VSWSVKHVYSSTVTDITDKLRLSDLSLTIGASPEPQGATFRLIDPFDAKVGAEIQVRDGDGGVQYRGWVVSIEREDHGPVAGLHPRTVLVTEDIYTALKRTTFPVFNEDDAGEALNELPAGLRKADRKYLADSVLDSFDMSVADVFGWALARIDTLESAKGSGRLPRISTSTANVCTAPIDSSTGSPFRFGRYFPQIIDGLTYWDVVNGIAALAGMNWYLRVIPGVTSTASAGLEIVTWDATEDAYGVGNPANYASYEVIDDMAAAVGLGQIEVLARSISLREDSSEVVNSVDLVYQPKNGNGVSMPKNVTSGGYLPAGLSWSGNKIVSSTSVAAYGERHERMVTDFITREMAIATGSRRVLSAAKPNIRGSARVLYDPTIVPGEWVMVHRYDHPEGAGYYKRRAFLHSLGLVFEDGYDAPVWMELSFNRDVYQAPNFRPFISALKPAITEPPKLELPPLILPPPPTPPAEPPITVTPGVPPVAAPNTPPSYRSSAYAVYLSSVDNTAAHALTYRSHPILAGSTRPAHQSRAYFLSSNNFVFNSEIMAQAIQPGATVLCGAFDFAGPEPKSVGTGAAIQYFTLNKPVAPIEVRGGTAYFYISPSSTQGFPGSTFGTLTSPATQLTVRVVEGTVPTASAAAAFGFLTGSRDDCKTGTYYTYGLTGKGGHRIAVPIPEPRVQSNQIHLVFAISAGLAMEWDISGLFFFTNVLGDYLIRYPARLNIGNGTQFGASRLTALPNGVNSPVVWTKDTPKGQLGWDPSNPPADNRFCWVLWETTTPSAGVVQSDGFARYQQSYTSGQFAFKLADAGQIIGNTLSVKIGETTHHLAGGLQGIYGDPSTTSANLLRLYPGDTYASLRAAILAPLSEDRLVGFDVRRVYPTGLKKVAYPKRGLVGPLVTVAYKRK
jgi:hypothetical protein